MEDRAGIEKVVLIASVQYRPNNRAVAECGRSSDRIIPCACVNPRLEDEATAAVPDEFIDQGALVGPRGRIRRRFRDWEDCGITGLTIGGNEEGMRFAAECARLNVEPSP